MKWTQPTVCIRPLHLYHLQQLYKERPKLFHGLKAWVFVALKMDPFRQRVGFNNALLCINGWGNEVLRDKFMGLLKVYSL